MIVTAAMKNVIALTARTAEGENAVITAPPSSGPANIATCSPAAITALAAGRSPASTRSGSMLPLAGQKNASASPKAAATA
jgi:hypothetical protein